MQKAASPIPDGYHAVTPQLICKDAEKALEFYKNAFGAQIQAVAKDPNGSVMHSLIKIGDSSVMVVDEYPTFGALSPASLKVHSPVTLHIYTADADALYAKATAAGAKPTMPICDAFWGDRYGQVVDPYGHNWSIATRKFIYTEEEMRAGMQKAMSEMAKPKTAGN